MNCIELPLSPEMAVPILLSSPCRRGARAAFRRFSAQNETCGDAWEATTGMGHQADPMLGSGSGHLYHFISLPCHLPPFSSMFPTGIRNKLKHYLQRLGGNPEGSKISAIARQSW